LSSFRQGGGAGGSRLDEVLANAERGGGSFSDWGLGRKRHLLIISFTKLGTELRDAAFIVLFLAGLK